MPSQVRMARPNELGSSEPSWYSVSFNSKTQLGTYPEKEESAEENSSSRPATGNKYMRRVLNQAARAAARTKGTYFLAVFRRCCRASAVSPLSGPSQIVYGA